MDNQDLLDKFAASALAALISKMPFYDSNGEYGVNIEPDKLQYIKKNLAATAYEYASWMLIAREDSKKWLKENREFFNKPGPPPAPTYRPDIDK